MFPEITDIGHQPVIDRGRVDRGPVRIAGEIGLVFDRNREGTREASYVREIWLKRVPLRKQSVELVPWLNHIVDETLRIHVRNLTPALTRGQPTEPQAREGDRRVERHVRRR